MEMLRFAQHDIAAPPHYPKPFILLKKSENCYITPMDHFGSISGTASLQKWCWRFRAVIPIPAHYCGWDAGQVGVPADLLWR